MITLYHSPLSPPCRTVRIALAEKAVDATLKEERIWERREDFLSLNPAGTVPVLQDGQGLPVVEVWPICEFLEEVYPERPLIGTDPYARAEARRLMAWFEQKFADEVSGLLLEEKVMKRMMRRGEPDSGALRAARHNMRYHLDYIGWLSERRSWLAGDELSVADIAAAAHLSCLDYLGDVPWEEYPAAKDWYARIKSRPSMRPLLSDQMPGLSPPAHYADLDF
ncbi:MAG: glutathione S-transferase family protein [Sneathiellaceae bacterium]